ncbi:MAG: MauE/DoxX family redox-associated membrane protein [Acidimicrobiales bacterium]|jgi:uncharacterized membrane protein YphA (DoxX/SURF4 family)
MGLIARVVVGIALLGSGALKLRDPRWPDAAHALGAPSVLVPLVAPVEIIVGALLAAGVGPPGPALLAVVLLGAFTLVLAVALRRPERPVCACFGALSAQPVSWRSVARNLVLVALAIVAAAN